LGFMKFFDYFSCYSRIINKVMFVLKHFRYFKHSTAFWTFHTFLHSQECNPLPAFITFTHNIHSIFNLKKLYMVLGLKFKTDYWNSGTALSNFF